MKSDKRFDEFWNTMNSWLEAADECEDARGTDAFKIGYMKSLAASMFAKLPKREREHVLAVLSESSVHEVRK